MILTASGSAYLQKRWQQALRGSWPVHEITDRIKLRHELGAYRPTVLLLDCELTRHRGVRQIRNLLQTSLSTRIMFFADHTDDTEAVAVLKAGACGYCSKTFTAISLRKAIDAVERGEIWAERRVISLLIRDALHSRDDTPAQPVSSTDFLLSPRERDIATMVGTGEQNKTISSHLSISEKTVKAHLTNIFKKLGLSSRTQLALFVRQNEFCIGEPLSLLKNTDLLTSPLQ